MSLESFSQPAGILSAVNTGAIIGGALWVNKQMSDRNGAIDKIYADMKKQKAEMEKIKALVNQMDNASVPKMTMIIDGLIENMNGIGKKINAYVIASEEKNNIRDRNMAALYEYIQRNDSNAPRLIHGVNGANIVNGANSGNSSRNENVTRVETPKPIIQKPKPESPKVKPKSPKHNDAISEDDDADIEAIIRMTSKK